MSVTAIAVPIVLEVARRIGAPMIEGVLRKHVGDAAGDLAGSVADIVLGKVADKAGVDPAELPNLPGTALEEAVLAAERETPELIAAQVQQQAETNRLLMAEMEESDSTWTWAWRPATMWGLLAGWIFLLCIVPIVNLFLALLGASTHLVLAVDAGTLLTLTGIYMGLYMGGHTIKDVAAKWREGRRG